MLALAVDDDASTARMLVDCLRLLGYSARSVRTGGEALRVFEGHDLVVLDLGLPDIDGHQVCRSIRAAGGPPVIALTAVGGEVERVQGLQAGADDCIDKPVGTQELAARIEAVMRRTRRPVLPPPSDVVVHGELRIAPGTRQVQVQGRPVTLTRKEFDLLHLLASEPERVFTRDELMTRVWQDNTTLARGGARASRTLDTHVGTLRQKLRPSNWIATVRGVGFRFAQESGTVGNGLHCGIRQARSLR